MGALALVLAAALLWGLSGRAPVFADQPRASGIVSTSPPAGGADAGAIVGPSSCEWRESQPVGRRRAAQPGLWENVGIGGNAPALEPEVVVILERVSFCDGEITIGWRVLNNMDDESVALPLTAENITVVDSLGTEYQVADEKSLPPQISAAPRSKASGTVTIPRPANLNARTLAIKLKSMPFGEATWIVPISGQTT
jgi:hypothetical protein